MIALNNRYTLAEVSENSFEAWIKHYRYARAHQSRQTSMQDNNTDCLKAMYLPSRHNIRKFEETPIVKNLRKDEVSKKIESFFILHEDGTKWKFIE